MNESSKRKCAKCKIEKDLIEFCKDKGNKHGRKYQCKACNKFYRDQNREKNKEKNREYHKLYRQENKDKIRERKRRYRQENKDKIRESERRYRQENKEELARKGKLYRERPEVKERLKRYEQENKDKINERIKLYRQENKDKINEYAKLYRQENKDKIKEYQDLYVRRAGVSHTKRLSLGKWRAKQLGNRVEHFTYEQLIEHWIANEVEPEKCFYCKEADVQHFDHYIPIDKGGSHTKENVLPACAFCNNSKGHKLPEIWLAEQQK